MLNISAVSESAWPVLDEIKLEVKLHVVLRMVMSRDWSVIYLPSRPISVEVSLWGLTGCEWHG